MSSRQWLLLTVSLALCFVWGTLHWIAPYLSAGRLDFTPLNPGNLAVPEARTLAWSETSGLQREILEHFANQPLPDWQTQGKTKAPRVLMGRLAMREGLEEANAYLQAAQPWGSVGSTWGLHSTGDYDFTLAGLVPILFEFGDDPAVLDPKTVDHLVEVLMTEEGGQPKLTVPRTLGAVQDTENHLLMTEGSRYLKNRWLFLHGSPEQTHDNVANGLESWLLKHLEELNEAGLHEFNSIPYEGYTLTALLNLEAFASEEVRAAARRLLDRLNWEYAVGSLSLRQFAPFRRQPRHAGDTALGADYQTALMKTWLSLLPDSQPDTRVEGGGLHHALWACWSPYRLPDETAQWAIEKPRDYLISIGHGRRGSPEIYSGGPGYLFTAGGVGRGKASQVVARPTTLMLEDGAEQLSEIIHLAGPGKDYTSWNNTGVWRRFAVAAGPVHVPEEWAPTSSGSLWSVYQRDQNLCVSVHSSEDLGIVHLSRSADPEAMLSAITGANNDQEKLRHLFITPEGNRISYDVGSPSDRWVIKRIDDSAVDREFDQWPRMKEL